MDSQTNLQAAEYEQTLLRIARTLPTFQKVQLLDMALLLQARLLGTADAKPVINGDESDERAWGRAAIRSLAKDWNTAEEDEAWAYLQEVT